MRLPYYYAIIRRDLHQQPHDHELQLPYLSHGRSIPLTIDLWRTSVDIQAGQAYSRAGGISCHGHAPADAVPGETGVPLRWLAARSLQALPAYVGGLVS